MGVKRDTAEKMYRHRKELIGIHAAQGQAGLTWKQAMQDIAELAGVSVSQFKPYMAMILKYEKEKGMNAMALQAENARMAEQIRALKAELSALRPDPDSPKGILKAAGWSLTKSGRYHRCFRKVAGKMFGIHIGGDVDVEKTLRKIKERESKPDFRAAMEKRRETI